MMKLFMISQDINDGYYTYDSAVVAAPDEATAQKISPQNGAIFPSKSQYCRVWGGSMWCNSPEQVKVRYIGEAAPDVEQGVICASFNAG